MISKNRKGRRKTHLYLAVVLTAATVSILLSAFIFYHNSLGAADESLRLQALGIAASLEPSLRDIKGKEMLFPDIITAAAWEGIAYIALYDKNGLTLLHSNESLVGRKVDLPEIRAAVEEGRPLTGYMTLGTGEEVFVMNYPISLKGSMNVLRLALHPYPAQDIIRQAKLQAVSVSLSVLFLWILGFFLVRAVRKSDELTALMVEKERLAVIGEMAAVLAHEIRNPLGSIKGFAQYLAEGRHGGSAELDVIISEAIRLERLTEDLLLFARPSEPRVEAFDLSGLVEETLGPARALDRVRQHAITLNSEVPEGLTAHTDREMLRQILANVVHNSVEASAGDGIISLAAAQSGNLINIEIRDNGCGMDKKTMDRAFDSFFTTKARGTGLGLAIVSRLLNALGGRIGIQSSPGQGSVITIAVPAKVETDHE
jgi:two-component system, NtrC family, sensor histidine kinase HydH